MSNAKDALNDVRGWLCGHLNEEEVGEVWCMLAKVSMRVHEADRLEVSNAKLREERDRLIEAIEELHSVSLEDRLVQLENDNAKLRELVKEMRVCLDDECKRCHEWGDACDLEHQMRELEIEVD